MQDLAMEDKTPITRASRKKLSNNVRFFARRTSSDLQKRLVIASPCSLTSNTRKKRPSQGMFMDLRLCQRLDVRRDSVHGQALAKYTMCT